MKRIHRKRKKFHIPHKVIEIIDTYARTEIILGLIGLRYVLEHWMGWMALFTIAIGILWKNILSGDFLE